MSEARKAFESHVNQYDTFGDEWQDKGVDEHFIAGYEAGKAARAGQESEPFAFCFTDVNGKPIEFCDHPKHAAEGDALIRTPLYTHPASAQAPEEIERDGINSTENLAYIDGYNDCAKEVRENARSNKQAASVPKHWRETMSDFQREERYVVFKLRDLVETEKDAVLRLANSINAQEIECVIVESDWPNYEHTWQTIERVSDGSYSDPYAEIERLQSRVAELEITHDGQAASMPEANKAWASSDPSWVLAHLKEETLFDTESIGEMLAFAKAAATSIPAKAASVPEWIKCSEQRPNVLDVWIKMTDGSVVACWAQLDGDFYWKGGGFESYILEHTVTHWKPRQEEQGHE